MKFNISLIIFKKNIVKILIGIVLFLVGVYYALSTNVVLFNKSSGTKQKTDITSLVNSTYIHFIYIGSSGCGYCNNPNTEEMIKYIKKYFLYIAHSHNLKYLTTGISTDIISRNGIKFLNKTGYYDEIISGGSWFNLGTNNYIWKALPGKAETPQILITLIKYHVMGGVENISNINRKEKVLKRIVGMYNIESFYKKIESNMKKQIILNHKLLSKIDKTKNKL